MNGLKTAQVIDKTRDPNAGFGIDVETPTTVRYRGIAETLGITTGEARSRFDSVRARRESLESQIITLRVEINELQQIEHLLLLAAQGE